MLRVRHIARRTRTGTGFTRVVLVLAFGLAGVAHGQVTREALIRAEDARGQEPGGLAPILDALNDPGLRRQAIRAIGRLERPELVGRIIPLLADTSLRATAAEAIAQAMRGLTNPPARGAAEQALLDSLFTILSAMAREERAPVTLGVLARSLARLPFADPRQARAAEAILVALVAPEAELAESLPALDGVSHGLYTLIRARRTLGDPSAAAVEWLRRTAVLKADIAGAARVRRLAWLALNASGVAERMPTAAGVSDPDPQVRRLALQAIRHETDSVVRRSLLARAARDPEQMVRHDWVAVHRTLFPADCVPIIAATRDASPHVALAAIDALSGPCGQRSEGRTILREFIANAPAGVTAPLPNGVTWHARAHALVALARTDEGDAAPLLSTHSRSPVWQVRMYAARGAALVRDTAILSRLAFDTVGNVREVAIAGLSTTIGHLGDRIYARALSSPDYHVVLAAARALRGAPVVDSVMPAVLNALERLHRERRQTSRDPRMELLARVDEMADRRAVPRLVAMLHDVDGEVAGRAAAIAGRLEPGLRTEAIVPFVAAEVPLPRGPVRVSVTMAAASGAGSFEILLDVESAPMTVARVVGLIRDRYYDGLTWHRVVPNFVLQGGSPAMNEYVGVGPFLRDELGLAHHERGTLGISTRGRDTGDAQWFINLVDNYRLDHEYTVFGRVVSGMDVVDRILEGDVMESVRIID